MLLDQGGVGIALRLGRYGGRGDRPAGLGIAAGLARIGGMAGGAGRRARITATPAAAEQDLATRRREAGKAWIGGAGLRRIIRQDRKIGRASGRENVCEYGAISGGDGLIKKKN